MTGNFIDSIKQRSRPEWEQLTRDRWTELRIWIQENGELAAVVSLVVGIFFVLAFKLVVILAVIIGLGGYGIWYLAPTQSGSSAKPFDEERNAPGVSNERSENSRPTEH